MIAKPPDSPKDRAVLVGIQVPGMNSVAVQASLDELGRLVSTLGLKVVGRLTQARTSTQTVTVLGPGKLRELASWTGGKGVVPLSASRRTTGSQPKSDEDDEPELAAAEPDEDEFETPTGTKETGERADLIVFDNDLSPSQLRNLEGATGGEVLDRSSVILEIFQRHARTREAKLQVEIARLAYLAPRLRATGGGGDRQRGGIGGKGAGETALELDRRRVRDRISELKQELAAVQAEGDARRARRSNRDTVALVGYTNAGKSSLMRALTATEVLVKDQLFATLDTTVRPLEPRTRPTIFVSDTVGFIKKLPHDLVASFRSTLEEARDAELLLYVVDASDPEWRSQLDVTRTVLGEIGAKDMASILILNKVDRLDDTQREALSAELPDALLLSAHDSDDIETLHGRIVAFFEAQMTEETFFIPYRDSRFLNRIHESCRVLEESFEDEGTRLRVLAPEGLIAELKGQLKTSA
ncbi:MAG: GTPase HflX [Myxococcales bacterium]|nr:GTPase HflX [Myxococcales bacterium]